MNDKILSLLGLMRKAGKVAIGADPVIDSVYNGKSYLVVMADDLSKNTQKTILRCVNTVGANAVTLNRSKDDISYAIGKFCAVLSIEDKGFAKKMQELVSAELELEEKI